MNASHSARDAAPLPGGGIAVPTPVDVPTAPHTVILLDPITGHADQREYPNAARAVRAARRAYNNGQEVVFCGTTALLNSSHTAEV